MSLFAARVRRRLKPPPPPPVPTTFEYLADFIGDLATTKNYTWIVPVNGWYKIFIWGRSGDGALGGAGLRTNSSNFYSGPGRSGGAVGGFGASLVFLRAGEQIPISILTTETIIGEEESELYIRATAGTNAGAGGQPSVGGSSSGGNIVNLGGFAGGNGGSYASIESGAVYNQSANGKQGGNNGAPGGTRRTSTVTTAYGGGGGGGARAVGENYCKYVAPNMSAYSGGAGEYTPTDGSSMPAIISGPSIIITGAGSGGAGATCTSSTALSPVGAGGTGQPGVVIIEKGVA